MVILGARNREDVLNEAICCTPGSGLPGAMVQIEAVYRMQNWDNGNRLHMLRTTQDGLGLMPDTEVPLRRTRNREPEGRVGDRETSTIRTGFGGGFCCRWAVAGPRAVMRAKRPGHRR